MNLRCYQQLAHDAVIGRFDAGDQSTLLVLPTGTGKTVVAAHVAKRFLAGGRVMVLAHRDELIRQAAEKFAAVTGILPSIEKADERSDENNMHGAPPIVVSSIPTLAHKSGTRLKRFNPCDFAFVWIDEGHHGLAPSWRVPIEHFAQNPACKFLYVTATEDRGDKKRLGKVIQSKAYEYQLPDAIDDGYLVPLHARAVHLDKLDFSKIETRAGDFNLRQLEDAMLGEEDEETAKKLEGPLHGVAHATIEIACGLPEKCLIPIRGLQNCGELLQQLIEQHGNRRRKTLVFTVGVKQAERMAEILNRWIPGSSAHIDGGMHSDRRRQILRRFKRGEVQFLVGCMVPTEGFDEPSIEVIVMARPTKSRALYAQMVGRGTRPLTELAGELGSLFDSVARRAAIAASSKPFLEVLDCVGDAGRHRLQMMADLFSAKYAPEAVARVRQRSEGESVDLQAALAEEEERLEQKRREAELKRIKREEEEERRRQLAAAKRARLVGTSGYHTQSVDLMDRFGVRVDRDDAPVSHLPPRTVATLRRNKVDESDIARMDLHTARALAGQLIYRHKQGLCTYRQAKTLQRYGYSKAELHTMTKDAAGERITEIAANHWQRPMAKGAAA